MLLIDTILQEIGDPANLKQIRAFDIKELGYAFSSRKIAVGKEGKASFQIYEILDEESKKAASFCYLYNNRKKSGIILSMPYDHYIQVKKAECRMKKEANT